MNYKRALIPVAAVAFVCGGIVAAYAATTSTQVTCPQHPAASGGQYSFVCTTTHPKSTETFHGVVPQPTPTPSPSASPSSSPTPTFSATPTPTMSPTPTLSATPTPTSTPPPAGFPDASNTGWQHTGVTLHTVHVGDSGPGWSAETVGGNPVLYVRSNGAVLDSLNIPMCVKVIANNVTISRSRIACASYYTVNVSDPPTYYSGLTLTDDEIDGLGDTSTPGIAVMGNANATYLRDDIHGFGSSGPRLDSGDLLKDSYIHGFVCNPPDHSAGSSANDGGSGIVVEHNTLDIRINGNTGNQCASAAFELAPDFGSYNGVTIDGNLFAGGAYELYTGESTGKAINISVTNNVFVRGAYVYGPVAQRQDGGGNVWSGNRFDDGAPLN